ncbi:PH domain-containing protein [uncultured Croceicoccus sp.]|uniref:PH domain-containing protein n=1 Tax=uncultured Croceicoccus sp. TaxID=1295329 RepID=UPI00262A3613|nr:PH domain-containing protein [uncultured Croceicoccus sp.]
MSDRADGGALMRTHPYGIAVRAAKGVWQGALGIAALAFGALREDVPDWVIWTAPVIVVIAVVGGACISWRQLGYRVGTDDIRVERGLINKEARSIPYDRIQDVSLSETLLSRLFGLVEVQFETGAGGKEEVTLAYVTAAEGARLREQVRDARARVSGDGGPARDRGGDGTDGASPPTATESAQTVFAMDNRRLVTFGAFEFSLLVFAVLAAGFQQFEFLLSPLIWDDGFWKEIIGQQGEYVAAAGVALAIAGAVLGLGALLLVGFVTGLVRTILRDYRFLLERTEKGFRRRRGLLTRSDVVMPLHRVQAAIIGTGAIRRLLGWHGLSFVSLASDKSDASHVVAPFATMAEIARIVAITGIDLPDAETRWHRPDARYFTDAALIGAVPLLLIAAGLAVSPYWPFAAIPVLVAGLIAGSRWLQWRRHRHALDDATLFGQVGLLSPELTAAPRIRLHSVEIAQGPLARMRGYARLNFGLAGGKFAIAGIRLDEARAVRARVLNHIAAVDFARLPR